VILGPVIGYTSLRFIAANNASQVFSFAYITE